MRYGFPVYWIMTDPPWLRQLYAQAHLAELGEMRDMARRVIARCQDQRYL